jgi:hypothetical protein
MSKRLLLYISFSIALCNELIAQEEFIEPASRYLTRVKFTQLTGGVILLQGQFGNFPDTMNFILDTGSGAISLDSTTAQ